MASFGGGAPSHTSNSFAYSSTWVISPPLMSQRLLTLCTVCLTLPLSALAADTFTLDSTVALTHGLGDGCAGGQPFKVHVQATVPLRSASGSPALATNKLEGTGWFKLVTLDAPTDFSCGDEGAPASQCVLQQRVLQDGQLKVSATFDATGERLTELVLLPVSPTGSLTFICREPTAGRLVPISLETLPLWLMGFAKFRQDPSELSPSMEGMAFKIPPLPKQTDPRGTLFKKQFTHAADEIREETTLELLREAPVVTQAASRYQKFFLRSVPAENPFDAEIDWRGAAGSRKVTFRAGAFTKEDVSGANVAHTTFDMGFEVAGTSGVVEVVAEAGGAKSAPLPIRNALVPTPPWLLGPLTEGLKATPGVRYEAIVHWPVNFDAKKTIENNVPFIAGNWGVFPPVVSRAQARNLTNIRLFADSDGVPTPGTADGQFDFVFGSKSLHFTYEGRHTATLSERGLLLEGDLEVPVKKLEKDQNFSWTYLFPGVAAVCAAPIPFAMLAAIRDEVCEDITFGLGLHLHGEASFAIVTGYRGAPAASSLEFTSLGARSDLDVHIRAEVGLPWIANASGRVGACGNLQLRAAPLGTLPPIAVKAWGGKLYATARAQLLGTEYGPWEKTHPFGPDDNCRVPFALGFPSPTSGWIAGLNTGGPLTGSVPDDSMPAFALAPAGTELAEVHAATVPGKKRPASRMELRTASGPERPWSPPLALSDAEHITMFPDVAFDGSGHALAVWAESPADLSRAGLADFQIAWASVRNGAIDASGTLTSEASMHLRPKLCRLDRQRVLAVWQTTNGQSLMGKKKAPLSFQYALWSGTAWAPPAPIAAEPLTGVLNWSLACSGAGEAAVAFTWDRDASYRTPKDRDVRLLRFRQGQWAAAPTPAADGVADEAVRAAFLPGGQLMLVWTRNDQLVAERVDGGPRVVLATFDRGGSPDLTRGQVATRPDGTLAVTWPAGRGTAVVSGKLGAPFGPPRLVVEPDPQSGEAASALLPAPDGFVFGRLVVPETATTGELTVSSWRPEGVTP